MDIKKLEINGFKSIDKLNLVSPNSFSVFVGPNGSGKTNIFEALELFELCNITVAFEAVKSYNSLEDITNQNRNNPNPIIELEMDLGEIKPKLVLTPTYIDGTLSLRSFSYSDILGGVTINESTVKTEPHLLILNESKDFKHWMNFTRLFIKRKELVKRIVQDDTRLALDGSNLEKVLKRILKNENKKIEIIELLQLLIPGFKDIEVKTQELSSTDYLLVHEQYLKKPLQKGLISDGTYNIIAIVTAIFQSDDPQFLCIEEPENGLNPKVVRQLVELFRQKCQQYGHYIWLNTHSQTLISELTAEEIILVDKRNGLTEIRQIKGMDLQGLKMDEALFANVFGAGIPW